MKKKKKSLFLDPVANAKVYGIVLIFIGILGLLRIPLNLPALIQTLFAVLLIAMGFGLRKSKIWALNVFVLIASVNLLIYLINLWAVAKGLYLLESAQQLQYFQSYSTGVIAQVIFALWFNSARSKYVK